MCANTMSEVLNKPIRSKPPSILFNWNGFSMSDVRRALSHCPLQRQWFEKHIDLSEVAAYGAMHDWEQFCGLIYLVIISIANGAREYVRSSQELWAAMRDVQMEVGF